MSEGSARGPGRTALTARLSGARAAPSTRWLWAAVLLPLALLSCTAVQRGGGAPASGGQSRLEVVEVGLRAQNGQQIVLLSLRNATPRSVEVAGTIVLSDQRGRPVRTIYAERQSLVAGGSLQLTLPVGIPLEPDHYQVIVSLAASDGAQLSHETVLKVDGAPDQPRLGQASQEADGPPLQSAAPLILEPRRRAAPLPELPTPPLEMLVAAALFLSCVLIYRLAAPPIRRKRWYRLPLNGLRVSALVRAWTQRIAERAERTRQLRSHQRTVRVAAASVSRAPAGQGRNAIALRRKKQSWRWLTQGQEAARDGDTARARACLRMALEIDEENDEALLWLAGVAESPSEAIEHLRRVLDLNPGSKRAELGLRDLEERLKPVVVSAA